MCNNNFINYIFQESLYHSEKYPLPLQIKSLSPSPLARHRVHPPCTRAFRSGSTSATNVAQLLPPGSTIQSQNLGVVTQPIPLITQTGPNSAGQLITIIRQRSHPERGTPSFNSTSSTSAQNEISCTRCTSWSGLSPTSCTMCCQQLAVPPGGGGGSGVHLTPKRYSSISSNDEFASIAADSMKINGAFKQFKQVRFF